MAAAALRTVFAGMFLAQSLVAAVVAAAFLLLGSPPANGDSSALGPVLAVLAPLQCLLGVLLPDRLARDGSKESSLSAILLAGVLLATPGWFFVLALVSGQGALPLTVLAGTVVAAYSLGFVQAGRMGARVATSAPDATAEADGRQRESG